MLQIAKRGEKGKYCFAAANLHWVLVAALLCTVPKHSLAGLVAWHAVSMIRGPTNVDSNKCRASVLTTARVIGLAVGMAATQ